MNTTSDRDAFIRAIIAEPDDVAPRLVFADWLDEHGEPERAEFIRLQIARSQQIADTGEHVAMSSRESELERLHGQQWLAGLASLPGVRPIGFHCGFVAHIEFAHLKAFRLHIEAVASTPFGAVTFTKLSPGTARTLSAMPELAHVRGLLLRKTGATAIGLAALLQSPHLSGLRKLWIREEPVTPEVMEAIGTHRLGLELLDVWRSGLDDASLSAFARAARLPRLRELHLAFNELGDVGVQALADARGLPGLHTLELQQNHVADAGAIALARSPHLEALRRLNLTHNAVGGAGAAALVARTSLEWVSLYRNPVGETAASVDGSGETIGPPASQRDVSLTVADLDDAGLTALLRWPGLETVTQLSLNGNPLRDAGLRALASAGLAGLERLNLSLQNAGPASLEAILLSPRLGRLAHLHVFTMADHVVGQPFHEPHGLPATVTLSLAGTLSRLAIVWLAESTCLSRVRGLNLSGDENELPRLLLPAPHLSSLEELTVASLRLSGLRALTTPHLQRLRRIRVERSPDGDVIAVSLAKLAPLVNLEELILGRGSLGDVGALALAESPHLAGLRLLDVRGNLIGPSAAARLRERFGARVLFSERRGNR